MTEAQPSIREALDAVADAHAYEMPLRRRAEGVTWMVWGAVVGAVSFSMAMVDRLAPAPWFLFLGLPILGIALAILLNRAVWQIAAIVAPAVTPDWRRILAAFVFVAASMILTISLANRLSPPDHEVRVEPVIFTIGTIWLLIGAFDIRKATPTGRRVLITIGLVLATAGLVLSMMPPLALAGDAGPLALGLILGLVPFLAGLWQVMRG